MSGVPGDAGFERPLPRGPHRLAREEVLASQRGRMLAAMADAVATSGYGQTTVADVIAGAGVSRKTFYEHFADKEACFLAAYDFAVEQVLERVRTAPAGDDPLGSARARILAYLTILAEEPGVAHTFLIEIGAAGPRALARRDRVLDAFAEVMADLTPSAPFERRLACVGAMDTLVTRHVRQGRARELPELLEELVAINVALLVPRR